MLFWLFLTLTSCVALVRDADNGVLTLATVWNLLNTFILSAFLVAAWREGRTLKRFAKAEQRGEVTDAPVVLTAPPGSAPASRRTQVSRPAPRTGEEILALMRRKLPALPPGSKAVGTVPDAGQGAGPRRRPASPA